MPIITPASVELVGLSGLTGIEPGGSYQIVSGTIAAATVITTAAPHNLKTGDTIFFTASTTSVPALTATPQQVVTVLSPTTFSVPVNCSTGATAGAYDFAIVSIPVAPVPTVNTTRAHGLRVGDTVTIVASGSTPSLDGAQVVTAVPSPTSFQIGAVAAITVAGSTTAAHYSKTTFYSDVIDRRRASGGGAVVITSLIGTPPNTCLVDIQGSVDGVNWFNVPYALVATPRTFVLTQLTITTSVSTTYLLQELIFWRFLRLKVGSSTNVRLTFQAAVLPYPN
jgi:hypothetical protein